MSKDSMTAEEIVCNYARMSPSVLDIYDENSLEGLINMIEEYGKQQYEAGAKAQMQEFHYRININTSSKPDDCFEEGASWLAEKLMRTPLITEDDK